MAKIKKDSINNSEISKELNCIYNIDVILKKYGDNIKLIFEEVVKIIPLIWSNPEQYICEIKYSDYSAKTCEYKDFKLLLTSDIIIKNKKEGDLIIYSIKTINKNTFKEDNLLLNSIAEKISKHLEIIILKKNVDKKYNFIDKNESVLVNNISNWLKSKSLNDENIENFLKVKLHFKKGETICKQGAFTTYIMLVAEGYTKATIENNNKKHYNFKITKPFSFMGISELFGNGYYHFSAIALTPSVVYLIKIEDFKNLIETNFEFAKYIMTLYCHNIEHLYNQLSNLANKQSNGKIAEVLLYLTQNVFNSNFIDNTITRKDLANMSGLSHEGTVRILSDFKKDKIIKILKSGIEITNMDLLKAISIAG